jgi:hypothetical protein
MNADMETDLYELNLRKKDARVNVLVGIVLLCVAAVFMMGFVVSIIMFGRSSMWIPGLGVVLSIVGGGAVAQGFRKRSAALAFERELRARSGR